MFNLDFLRRSSLMDTTLCTAPRKSNAFSTNYQACIVIPTWRRCAPPILLWSWPLFNLFPSSRLTLIFFNNPQWGVPLCVQRPTNSMPFKKMIMLYYCIFNIVMPTWYRYMHLLFCFVLDLHLACSQCHVLSSSILIDRYDFACI